MARRDTVLRSARLCVLCRSRSSHTLSILTLTRYAVGLALPARCYYIVGAKQLSRNENIMRKNCQRTLAAWRTGKSLRAAQSIWTDGETIFSYGTALVTGRGDQTILNRTTYSSTTSQHQNALAAELESFEVEGLEQGVTAHGLLLAATEKKGARS